MLYAWAKDSAGNVSTSRSATVVITLPDTTRPIVTAFTIPATATNLTVPITTLTATDTVGVTGYMVTESSTAPSPSATGWTLPAPASYTFATAGSKMLYAWAKDSAGNVSTSRSATVVITLPDTPSAGNRAVVVLVNQLSASYWGFEWFVKPYLDNFGIPYRVLDIAIEQIPADVGDCALIIVGHRQLDIGDTRYLDAGEQGYISAAVNTGAGLVNFDNDLFTDSGTPRYMFIQDIFGFAYQLPASHDGVSFPDPASHYITERHAPGETISTADMALADISLPGNAGLLVTSGTRPFLSTTVHGSGRAVQWGTYDWMSHSVKGPLLGLDDLVWRSIVWSARKPFAMQGIPPFVTMRVDDIYGPLWWIPIANDYGLVPWVGVFTDEIEDTEAAELSNLVREGKATAAIHAYGYESWFYYDHYNKTNYSDATMAQRYAEATGWFNYHQIPISKYLVAHYYELGSNVFSGLESWGVEFIGTEMNPGQPAGDVGQWMAKGPFRLYETGSVQDEGNIYYADYITVPGHPEMEGKFFNCFTEIRDLTGYDWLSAGRSGVSAAIQDGTEGLKRAFDSMVLATLFTHEPYITGIGPLTTGPISQEDWRTILQTITQNIAPYDPIYVSMEYACRYVRAIYNSNIFAGDYNADTREFAVTLGGSADMETNFYVFTESGGYIQQQLIDAPAFVGSTQVVIDTTFPPDITPPVIVSISPASGATEVGSQTTVTATFSEPVDPTSIGPGTFELRDGSDFQVPSAITYNGTTRTATLRPGNPLAAQTTYTARVAGGAVGVRDLSGNELAADHTWSFTISAEESDLTYNIWASSTVPANPAVNVGEPGEVGVKFRSQLPGYITGVRFYKGAANTGTHVGNLWTGTGTLLASATFTNETASGWQEVLFPSPVPITANTTYVASYHINSGYVAFDESYFVDGVYNNPLQALRNGEDGPNGVYKSGASGFPTLSWQSTNYWVDVVFRP
jgi:hypothetical protein